MVGSYLCVSGSRRAIERARRGELEVAPLLRRQEPVDARLLYLHLDRAAAFSVELNCEEEMNIPNNVSSMHWSDETTSFAVEITR